MQHRSFLVAWITVFYVCSSASLAESQDDPQQAPGWRKHTINDRSPFEGAGAADFNDDGLIDVFSGDSWYEAPTWKRHKVRTVLPGRNPKYHDDFADLPIDVNGDGYIDIVTCAYFSGRVAWVEHPGDPTQQWKEHTVDLPGPMETGRLVDLNSDGQPDFLPNTVRLVTWYEFSRNDGDVKWQEHNLGEGGAGHGVGAGDINRDGRTDIITVTGWYEQPDDANESWPFHEEFDISRAGILIIGRDFDHDGDTDIVWGIGHDYGLYWLQQSTDVDGQRVWTRSAIDESFSQVHSLHLADLDGDSEPEVVTGKRVYAHEVEPGATEASCIYSYHFDPKGDSWVKRVIYEGKPAANAPPEAAQRSALDDFEPGTAGTGLQMDFQDMDADGDIDIVCPGKTGLYWFENLRIAGQQ